MPDYEAALPVASELLKQWTQSSATPEPGRLDVTINPADLLAAIGALDNGRWGYLAAITGLDLGVEQGQLEVLYHFCSGPGVLTLRVLTPRTNAMLDSICGIIPSASFFERELMEMFGVTLPGSPNSDHLFLPDTWPDETYPMRKDFVVAAAVQDEGEQDAHQ